MNRKPCGLTAVALVGLLSAACASGTGGPVERNAGAAETMVEVTNNNWADVRVFAVKHGMRTRLGTVSSMATETFRVPVSLQGGDGGLRLLAWPIGSTRAHETDLILAGAGDRIRWNVENRLAQSHYMVQHGVRR